MLPQNALDFHAVGLVRGLQVSLGFLAWKEERDPQRGE